MYDSRGIKKVEIPAQLIRTNITDLKISIDKMLFYGLKSEGDSYIQVYDFDGNVDQTGESADQFCDAR